MRKRDEDKIADKLVLQARKVLDLLGEPGLMERDGYLRRFFKFPMLIKDTGADCDGIVIKWCDDGYETVCREIVPVVEREDGRKFRLKRLTSLTHEIELVNKMMAQLLPLEYLADI